MCETLLGMIKGDLVDPVTRLPNSKFLEELEKSVKDDLKMIEVSVTLENLDSAFKDIAISRVASVIKHSVRIPMDMVVRVGDYDFMVILGNADESTAKIVAERLRTNLSYLNMGFGGKTVKVKPTVRIKN